MVVTSFEFNEDAAREAGLNIKEFESYSKEWAISSSQTVHRACFCKESVKCNVKLYTFFCVLLEHKRFKYNALVGLAQRVLVIRGKAKNLKM